LFEQPCKGLSRLKKLTFRAIFRLEWSGCRSRRGKGRFADEQPVVRRCIIQKPDLGLAQLLYRG